MLKHSPCRPRIIMRLRIVDDIDIRVMKCVRYVK